MKTSSPAATASLAAALVAAALLVVSAGPAEAQQPESPVEVPPNGEIELTLERMVDFALSSSYRMQHLNLDIERSRLNLQASRSRLRSRVDLDFSIPTINYVSETRWDPDIQRNVIQRENSRRMDAELSIRQPVILFGYPTNGYLSLNSRLYQLRQVDHDESDIRYYNRYFVSYSQPLFQTNVLKNDLEEAELDLEGQELDFYDDVVGIVDNASDDYFELFEVAYEQSIREDYVDRLEQALTLAEERTAEEPDRAIDVDRIQVELGNAREQVISSESRFRLETASLKTELGIPQGATLTLDPQIQLARVPIDVDRAVEFALELTPRMRQLEISRRESEIRLDNTKGRGGFELDLSLSYGREMQNEIFRNIWEEPENSYTVDLEGSLPLWDWGERDARIRAQEISLEQSRLRIQETTENIRTDIENVIQNVAEYEDRAYNMDENLGLSRTLSGTSMEQYRDGQISAVDLLATLRRESDTAENLLDAYIGWREALQRVQEMTYYDWENDVQLLEHFGVSFENGIQNN